MIFVFSWIFVFPVVNNTKKTKLIKDVAAEGYMSYTKQERHTRKYIIILAIKIIAIITIIIMMIKE